MTATPHLTQLVEILQPARKTRIIDVGANPLGEPPYAALLKAGLAEVWGFEPQPSAFAKLQELKGENEHYLPHAVGDGRDARLNICKGDGFSSIYEPNMKTLDYLGRWHRGTRVMKTIDLPTQRLDDLDMLPKPDLLKIDVQGAEAMIFRNGREKLSDAVTIITEVAVVPIYVGQPLLQEQAAILYDYGHILHKFLFMKSVPLNTSLMKHLNWRKHRSQAADGDAVFIKSLLEPEQVTDEQLIHLAICADSVFASYDLVLKCLSLLIERGRLTEETAISYVKLLPHQAQG